jgi:hypothetical protein
MKLDSETRDLAFQLSHGYCRCSPECVEKADQAHHLLPKSKVNQRLYPLFVHSIFNICPIFNGCHMTKPLPTIKPHEAEIYERYLQKLVERENRKVMNNVKKYISRIKKEISGICKINT